MLLVRAKEKKKKFPPPKKRKRANKNYSIKAPTTTDASEGVKFNYKTLQFERVTPSPSTKQPNVPPISNTSEGLKFNYKTLQFEKMSPSPIPKPLHAPGSTLMQDRYSIQ